MSDKKPAVISLGGKQHLVYQGAKVVVNRIETEVDAQITLTDLLNEVPVVLKVVEHSLGDKIDGLKFHSKSNYLKRYGHRQTQTVLEVISVDEPVKPVKKAETPKAEAKPKAAAKPKTVKKPVAKATKEKAAE